MHEQSVLLSIPAEEAGWLGDADVSGDSPELQIHVKRMWLLPDSVFFRVRSGMFELLAEPSDVDEVRHFMEINNEVRAAVERNECTTALETLSRILELNPHCREHREQQIRILMDLDRYPEAFDATLDALRLDPEYSIYHSLLAHCLNNQDEDAHQTIALDSLTRAVALGSIDPQDFAILGAAALDAGNSLEALDWSAKALKLDPRSLHGLRLRALALTEMKRYSEATFTMEEAASLIPAECRDKIVEIGLPDPYVFCCKELLEATSKFPWSRVEREIALIEAEYGWSVDLVEADQPETYDDSDSVMPKELEWLDARAPGTVRIHISGNPRQRPISVLRDLMLVRVDARHLQRLACHHNIAVPTHLDQQLEVLVREHFTQKLGRSLLEGAPEDLIPALESAILMMAATPLDWLSILEVLERLPNLRHPVLFEMAEECFLLQQAMQEFDEDPEDEPFTELSVALIQPFMIAKMLFLADQSRGVLGEAWRYRNRPTWQQAVQIYDHFRAYLRLPVKKQRPDHLLIEIATIVGLIPSPTPIHTQGVFW